MIDILCRGKGYVIVKKPVASDSEDTGEDSVPALVREAVGAREAYPVHRLDKVVGGAMLVATDKAAATRLSVAVQEDRIKKEYICICEGVFDSPSGKMLDLLYFDRSKKKSYPVKKMRNGVKDASLSYEVIAERTLQDGRRISMCRVLLETGRTHQIRVQFASRAHSILGDGKYGSRDKGCAVALMCHALTVDGVRTECSMPADYPWNLFEG